ncbi:ExeA family protein [Porticoccus sp. GXU_MW_L64]
MHAQQGGFSVVIGLPGVGKTVLREAIEALDKQREYTVVCCSRTLHTYRQILWQLADAFKLHTTEKAIEGDLIQAGFEQVRERKTLYILIDEAHLLEIAVLRKLRLLFERFPKNHNLVLLGQPELLHYLSLGANRDIKSRITYSASIKPLNDDDMENYVVRELEAAKMGINTFDEAAMALIIRSAEGNLRLCRNLCLGSLIEAARETQKIVTITHVNNVLVQPHWRSHDELIKQQATT